MPAVVLKTGDEVMECIQTFADAEELSAASFSAIGAFSEADLHYFDWETLSRGWQFCCQ